MRFCIGTYLLGWIDEANCACWEREGYHVNYPDGGRRYLCEYDLEKAKWLVLGGLPEACRPFVIFEGVPC